MFYRNPGRLFVALICLAIVSFWPAGLGAQGQIGITEPAEGDTISGIVIIKGSAVDPSFMRYELAFRHSATPDWIVFAQGDQSVIDGTLAVWDTTVGRESDPVFPDGVYQLRLRVVRSDYNYDEYFVRNINVLNDEATPTPTPTRSDVTATPIFDTSLGTSQPDRAILPSLTPFPTTQPRATPIDALIRSGQQSTQDNDQGNTGVIDQITSLDTDQFGRAFWRGVFLVALAFAALALYLLFRGAFRRIWRIVLSKLLR